MKQTGILFSTPMVQAIMEDRKTMTRRIVKPAIGQKNWLTTETINKVRRFANSIVEGEKSAWWTMAIGEYKEIEHCGHKMDGGHIGSVKCLYGVPGDILYVRETWQRVGGDAEGNDVDGGVLIYKADGEKAQEQNDIWGCESGRWAPSLFMPKAAARIWLEITDIRVERVQDITQEDAKAEGMIPCPHRPSSEGCKPHKDGSIKRDCYWCAFQVLWDRINGSKGHQWSKNEWVWVISFKVLSKTGMPDNLKAKTIEEI